MTHKTIFVFWWFQAHHCLSFRTLPQNTWWETTAKLSPNFCLFLRTKFWVDFLLAVVATPLLGMDFLTKFSPAIIPSKQQVLQSASGRTFSKASVASSLNPGAQRPPPLSWPRYSSFLRNSQLCCGLVHGWLHCFFQNRLCQSLRSDPHSWGRCPQNGNCHPFWSFWVPFHGFWP